MPSKRDKHHSIIIHFNFLMTHRKRPSFIAAHGKKAIILTLPNYSSSLNLNQSYLKMLKSVSKEKVERF